MIPSLDIMALAAGETRRVSLAALADTARGRVSSEGCDERLNSLVAPIAERSGDSSRREWA